MTLPKQVQKQSEDVQALYKELNGETEENAGVKTTAETTTEVPTEETTTAPSDSVEKQAPKSDADEHSISDDKQNKDSWEQKYKTLQGMYNTDVPRLNATNRSLDSRVAQLESLLGQINTEEKPAVSTEPAINLITEDDEKEYGDSIDVMRRAAQDTLAPGMARVNELEKQLRQLQNVVPQVQQVQQSQKSSEEKQFWNTLNQEVPNWNEINSDQDFQSWLLEIDQLTGLSRQTYLADAQQKLDVNRVIKFFSTYEKANGKVNDARETHSENSELAKQVAPGRGRSAKPAVGEGKTYTRKDITKFFEDVRFGKYKGREAERGKKERDIFAAQQEGRIA
tara:strand:- start:680 stop:1693 length:1014 start_codon:yes stop_codon:yes gene_type:complete